MTKIIRTKVITEEVQIPAGYRICTYCKGKGMMNKYDEGWSTPVHDPEFAALKECFICQGLGYKPDV